MGSTGQDNEPGQAEGSGRQRSWSASEETASSWDGFRGGVGGSGGARRGGREALRGRCGTPPARPSKYNLKMCFGQLREAVRRIPPGGCSTAFWRDGHEMNYNEYELSLYLSLSLALSVQSGLRIHLSTRPVRALMALTSRHVSSSGHQRGHGVFSEPIRTTSPSHKRSHDRATISFIFKQRQGFFFWRKRKINISHFLCKEAAYLWSTVDILHLFLKSLSPATTTKLTKKK